MEYVRLHIDMYIVESLYPIPKNFIVKTGV